MRILNWEITAKKIEKVADEKKIAAVIAAIEGVKICALCKWCSQPGVAYATCTNPSTEPASNKTFESEEKEYLVTGIRKPKIKVFGYCTVNRLLSMPCGPEGKLFERAE